METKKVIRQQLLARREEISESLRKQYNERILEKVINHPWYKEAEEILLYISYGSEVDTLELCRICFQAGKRVYCPKVMDRGRMEFYAIHSLEELTEGSTIYITNPWETLTYTVQSVRTASPRKTDELTIQEGRDLLTIFTCSYPNSRRVIVTCERSDPLD